MAEDKSARVEPELALYSRGRAPDIIAVVLILTGTLVSVGYFSSNPGQLVRPFCLLMKAWFGSMAVALSILTVVIGIAILLMRWVLPKVRMSIPKRVIYLLCILIVIIDVLLLCAYYGGEAAGGSAGMGLARLLCGSQPPMLFAFEVWVTLIIAVCILAGGLNWGPKLFRELGGEIKGAVTTARNAERNARRPKETDPGFDWKTEYKAESKQNQQRENASAESEAETDPVAEPVIPPKRVMNMSEIFKSMENPIPEIQPERTEQRTSQTGSSAGGSRRLNNLPPLNLLDTELGFYGQNEDHQEFIQRIEEAMAEFGAPVKVIGCSVGPSVVQYQVIPGQMAKEGKVSAKNIRVNQVAQCERDLAVSLGVSNLSIQAPVPGESYIGIDIPNPNAMKVRLRPLLESPEFTRKPSPLNVALGRDITGCPVVVNLENMPHLLVAGTTNSGKSICLRAMAVCLAMNNTPDQLRFVMIDPKRVEFYRFNGLPHLLGKVETEYERSIAVLEWAVQEMKSRYQLFETVGARKLSVYNKYAEAHGQKPLPYIVIIIDEMAEIMKGADKQGQVCIDKLASLARATGMHLVVATQRPDTTIVTGKIKTNIPARIALNVASAVDSRVIMGKQGAEKLLGRGDMYFIDPTLNVPMRVQGALLTDNEIEKVVNIWKKLAPKPTGETAPWEEILEEGKQNEMNKDEKKLKDAIRLVCRTKKASSAYISGKLNVSFPTASRLLNRMEEMGVVGPMQLGGKAREVLWDESEAEEFAASLKNNKNITFEEDEGDFGFDE
jgi:DNA segregation ATPase FtsK/SpoIIIE-like protein